MKFHDGTDFNAQAIIDNWNWVLDEKNASPRRSDLQMIEKLSAPKPFQLIVQFTAPFSPFLATLAGRTGMISSPAAMKKYGNSYDLHPTGTGPFKFKEWNKNDHLTIVKNDDYWQKSLPKLDQIEFKPITDPSQKKNALISGQVDLVDSIPFQEIPTVEKTPGIKLGTQTSFGFNTIWINNVKAPFDNLNNRKAINLAINREEINKLIYFGHAVPAYSQFSTASWANDEKVTIPFSIEKAKEELKKAGNPDGFKFKMLSANDTQSLQLMQLVKDQLAKAGIEMEIEAVDSTTYLEKAINGDFQATNSFWSGMVDPDQNSFAFDVKGTFFNWGSYHNSKVEELLQGAREAQDQSERKELYSQVASIMNEDGAYSFLVYPPVVNAWKENIKGYEIYPDQLLRLSHVYKEN